jgi:hypothetical protein
MSHSWMCSCLAAWCAASSLEVPFLPPNNVLALFLPRYSSAAPLLAKACALLGTWRPAPGRSPSTDGGDDDDDGLVAQLARFEEPQTVRGGGDGVTDGRAADWLRLGGGASRRSLCASK